VFAPIDAGLTVLDRGKMQQTQPSAESSPGARFCGVCRIRSRIMNRSSAVENNKIERAISSWAREYAESATLCKAESGQQTGGRRSGVRGRPGAHRNCQSVARRQVAANQGPPFSVRFVQSSSRARIDPPLSASVAVRLGRDDAPPILCGRCRGHQLNLSQHRRLFQRRRT
jgi:hypothetical protein